VATDASPNAMQELSRGIGVTSASPHRTMIQMVFLPYLPSKPMRVIPWISRLSLGIAPRPIDLEIIGSIISTQDFRRLLNARSNQSGLKTQLA